VQLVLGSPFHFIKQTDMKKILFQGTESDLLISKKDDQIVVEMIDSDCNINDYQLGDNYNIVFLSKEDAIDLAEEILKLTKNGKE